MGSALQPNPFTSLVGKFPNMEKGAYLMIGWIAVKLIYELSDTLKNLSTFSGEYLFLYSYSDLPREGLLTRRLRKFLITYSIRTPTKAAIILFLSYPKIFILPPITSVWLYWFNKLSFGFAFLGFIADCEAIFHYFCANPIAEGPLDWTK